MSKRIGILDYNIPIGMLDYGNPVVGLIAELRFEGYEVRHATRLADLDTGGLDVLLMHPGVDHQAEAAQFVMDHPEIRAALLSPSPDQYPDIKTPIFQYDRTERIIDFIEGRQSQPKPPADF